jgi:Domain of unknown function (DUF6431)
MQIIHHFNIDISTYIERGYNNDFPTINRCKNPKCLAMDRLYCHDFYERNGINKNGHCSIIVIRRLRCRHCGMTFSILPSFMLPYFQHFLSVILDVISDVLNKKREVAISRQLRFFHLNRYLKCLKWSFFYFKDDKNPIINLNTLSPDASFILSLILKVGPLTFNKSSWSFMKAYFLSNKIG